MYLFNLYFIEFIITLLNINCVFISFCFRIKANIFTILKGEETAGGVTQKGSGIGSSFTSRIANGISRRSLVGEDDIGEYFLDLKLYKSSDIANVPPETRYKKALSSLKLLLDEDSPAWEPLQLFLVTSFQTVFKNCEPKIYSDKVTIKN